MACTVLRMCLVGLLLVGIGSAQDQTMDSSSESANASRSSVLIGLGGHYRVGRATCIRLGAEARGQFPDSREEMQDIRLETLDGDGVRVSFDAYPGSLQTAGSSFELGYVVPGSEAAPLSIVRRSDSGDEVIAQTRFPMQGIPSRGPSLIPNAMPWVVSIGDPLGVEKIGASNVLRDKAARIAVTQVDSADALPAQSLGYDGVDLVMINAKGLEVLESMSDAQRDSLANWLREGGRIFVCLGRSAPAMLNAAPWLKEMLPIEDVELSRMDPAALETYTNTQERLSNYEGLKLPRNVGNVLLSGRTTRRVSAVIAVEFLHGLGKLTVLAVDLDESQYAEWSDRTRLVTQITDGLFEKKDEETRSSERPTAFEDLAGQMRGGLDRFDIKPYFSFSLVSLVILILITAIGPLDYLVINRVFGKPLLGWLTFPAVAIALSVFLVAQAKPKSVEDASSTSDSLVRANQFQITDLDLVDGVGRAFNWSYVYSHQAVTLDARFLASDQLLRASEQSTNGSKSFAYPMGYPGKTFGGVQLAGENSLLPTYQVHVQAGTDGTQSVDAFIDGISISPRSSKSIAIKTSFSVSNQQGFEATRRPGGDYLRGEFTNPLPFDLLDGMLIYQNFAYVLPTRLPAGKKIASLFELTNKNFRWRLTRKEAVEKTGSQMDRWSPKDFADSRRIGEMLLFYRAAGGEHYTGLRHDALGELDLSHLLGDDRCMLIGRTESPLVTTELKSRDSESDSYFVPQGETVSMVRVILPVRSTRLN